MGGVYILHYTRPVKYKMCNHYGDKRHYVGFTTNRFAYRIGAHAVGNGAAMTKAAFQQEIPFYVGAMIPTDDPALELVITRQIEKHCTLCKGIEW